jgi:DNA-binding transcriptional MerR regulator
MDGTAFRIGEVASGAGVSVDTVRYYERLKLLPRASRSSGNFRFFAAESIERVRFIKQAQELGLTLHEIKGLLSTGSAAECRKVRDLLSKKIEELDIKMRAMKDFRRTLVQHHAACKRELETHGNSACCPVVAGKRKIKS